jgi:hypothetical protein
MSASPMNTIKAVSGRVDVNTPRVGRNTTPASRTVNRSFRPSLKAQVISRNEQRALESFSLLEGGDGGSGGGRNHLYKVSGAESNPSLF